MVLRVGEGKQLFQDSLWWSSLWGCSVDRAYLELEITLSQEQIQKYTDCLQFYVNNTLKELRRLFLVQDLVDSLKVWVLKPFHLTVLSFVFPKGTHNVINFHMMENKISANYILLLSLQSCLTLCDPIDSSLPGSSVHGIFQARVLEWGAIAFSNYILGSENVQLYSLSSLMSSSYRCWNYGSERLRHLPEVAQWVTDRAGTKPRLHSF